MILHIIKKDLRLLWPFVIGLTALNVFAQWAALWVEHARRRSAGRRSVRSR